VRARGVFRKTIKKIKRKWNDDADRNPDERGSKNFAPETALLEAESTPALGESQ
jgi:hypothetical protein